jgi:hypothetical protein
MFLPINSNKGLTFVNTASSLRRVGHHDENDVGLLRDFLAARAGLRARLHHVGRHGRHRMHEQLVAGLQQVSRHRRAHDAQADEAQLE